MSEDTTKIIADDRVVDSLGKNATAQTSIAATYKTTADAMAELSTFERSDEAIYREACRERMGLANKAYADLPAVLKYAEAYLAAIRQRFPRTPAVPSVTAPLPPISTAPVPGPAVG